MRFSVIVPLYNKAPYVNKALQSIIGQSFKDFEVIVVDDGSHDESYSLAESALASSNCCYQLIHQENAGVSMARNNGVAASQGDYLCFLDADDWWAPTILERMDWLIKEYPEAGIYGTNYYYIKNGQKKISVTTADTGYINYCKVYAERLQMPLWTGATCISRCVFTQLGGFDPGLKLGEDFCLWIKAVFRYKVAFLNEALSYYYQDSNPKWRLVGKLHPPQEHMLWNLGQFEKEEKDNSDFKVLIDRLRTYSLMPYYLSKQYRQNAKQELAKVDWSKQPKRICIQYHLPILLLRFKQVFFKIGSFCKQCLLKLFKSR